MVFCNQFLLLSIFSRSLYQQASVFHFSLWLNNSPLYGYTTDYPFINSWNLGCFQVWAIRQYKHLYICFVLLYIFISFGYKPRHETAGSYSTAMLNCLRNWQNVFQNGVTILHSLQQSMNVPISPHSNQKWQQLSDIFIILLIMGMK